MKITELHKITFDTDENIMTATLSTSNEVVMLMSSGNVIRYNINDKTKQNLFPVKSCFTFEDGGFDINAPSTIYTLNSIVVIVNDYKRHGYIHYPDKYQALHLWRDDYHADISSYPIALYEDKTGVPHIIYAKAWNHLQIMNLDTRQILTAAKSLIEENAEEDHIEFYKKHEEANKLSWPSPYDYFYGKLEVSPDKLNFLSAGWAWGSSDAYNIYEIEDFIKNNRISDKPIGYWEHCNRAVCWIDNNTVAIAYNPLEEGDENVTKDSPQEIHFHKMKDKKVEIERKIKVPKLNLVSSTMRFSKELISIIVFSEEIGLALLSLEGEIIFHDEKINVDEYYPDLNLFIKTDKKTVSVYQIKNGSSSLLVADTLKD